MDAVSVSEANRRPRVLDPPYDSERRYHASRLPTPETTQGSDDVTDESILSTSYKRPYYDPVLQRDCSVESVHRYDPAKEAARSRRDSAVHSPPYHPADIHRPSLPPLKTLLASSNLSPPKTPSPRTKCLEPSPRKPSLATSTIDHPYMPPSFHPNKKQKTCSSQDSDSHYGPSLLNVQAPISGAPSSRPGISLPSLSSQLDTLRTQSVSRPSRASPPWSEQYPSTAPTYGGYKSSTGSDYHTPDRTPVSYSRSSSVAGSMQDMLRPYESREPSVHREPSDLHLQSGSYGGAYGRYGSNAYEWEGTHSRPAYHNTAPARYPGDAPMMHRDGSRHRAEVGDELPPPPPLGHYPAGAYQFQSPPFIMPNHFDFQQGKARKRSNLPKQSTEIMKRWFDQNIGNPYPSEEQKQRFSSMAGISITQVSNWFINHRRRCPELRDKRDKGRSHENDM